MRGTHPERPNPLTFGVGLAVLAWLSLLSAPDGLAQLERLRKAQAGSESTTGDHARMVSVPAGEFAMGVDGLKGLDDERPRHVLWLDAYEIDAFEITTSRYARFLSATKRPPPLHWEVVNPAIHRDRPVIGVTWEDAAAFCRWAGKRLPTEAEWEKAARGTDERKYPWGNMEPTGELANFGLGVRFSYSQALMPVAHYEGGKSAYGAHGMAGNVYEWVADWYQGSYYEQSPVRNPTGPPDGQFKVLRGGSWSDLAKYLLTYSRFKLLPDTRNAYTGFRCARTIQD